MASNPTGQSRTSAQVRRSGTDEVSVSRGDRTAARLCFVGGADHVQIQGDADTGDLIHVRTPDPRAEITVDGDTVRHHAPRSLLPTRHEPVVARLSTTVRWTIECDGSARQVTADLRDLDVGKVAIAGSASKVRLALPHAHGAVPVVFGRNVSAVMVLRTGDTPVRVRIDGGVRDARLDAQRMGGVSGPLQWHSATDDEAGRYDIVIAGKASKVTVGRVSATDRLPTPMPRWLPVFNRVNAALLRLGVPTGPGQHLLSIPGRRTGALRTTPIAVVTTEDGRRHVVAGSPDSDWVHNARASGWGLLGRGKRLERVRMTELVADERAAVIARFVEELPIGRKFFGMEAGDASEIDEEAAASHPVFALMPLPEPLGSQTRPDRDE